MKIGKYALLIFCLLIIVIIEFYDADIIECSSSVETTNNSMVSHCYLSNRSQEKLRWEKLLKWKLGNFYYSRYIEAKKAGRKTAWDYVDDLPNIPRILIIGDSISRGYTLPVRQILEGLVNVHRTPEISGDTKSGLKNLDFWIADGKWDLIIYNFGIHDRFSSLKDYSFRLNEITERLKTTGAALLWVTTTPVPEGAVEYRKGFVESINIAANNIMNEEGITVLDLNFEISPFLEKFQRQKNCHFNKNGYVFMGNLIANAIIEELHLN